MLKVGLHLEIILVIMYLTDYSKNEKNQNTGLWKMNRASVSSLQTACKIWQNKQNKPWTQSLNLCHNKINVFEENTFLSAKIEKKNSSTVIVK